MKQFDHNATLRLFADHWASLPQVDCVPHRRDFQPEKLGSALAHIVIHELISPMEIRLRLVGSTVASAYDEEITGRNYLDMVEPDRRDAAAQTFFTACRQPCGMYTRLRSVGWRGRTMERESLGFPLRDESGVRWFYSCSTTDPADTPAYDLSRDGIATVTDVLERLYVDIGAGVPAPLD